MSVFRFKRFEVVNERSARKVNTDGVLLGASMTVRPSDRRLLDIGTGTGTIALMAAQRLSDSVAAQPLAPSFASLEHGPEIRISAIDIDEASATEAGMNFANSPWADCLAAHLCSLDEFAQGLSSEDRFDLIFSNPPYFEDSLLAPEQRRCNARHTATGLSYREILEFAAQRLNPQGRVAMVLPADLEHDLLRHARMNGLHLFHILRVRTVERKQATRIIAEFSKQRCESPEDELLTIQKEARYSHEYLALMHGFYLFA